MSTLHTLRRRANLSLSALAEQSGVSVRRLAEYEYGDVPLDVIDRSRLAAFFGIDGAALAGSRRSITTPLLQTASLGWWAMLGAVLALGLSSGMSWQAVGAALKPLQATPPVIRRTLTFAPLTAQLTSSKPTPVPIPTAPSAKQAVVLPAQRAYAVVKPERCPLLAPDGMVLVTTGYQPSFGAQGVMLGVDLDANGTADHLALEQALVVAAHAGIIERPNLDEVLVRGADGWLTRYGPLTALAVQAGQHVRAGQLLGTIAPQAQAAQLTFAVWQHGISRDPSEFVLCAAHNHAPLGAGSRNAAPTIKE